MVSGRPAIQDGEVIRGSVFAVFVSLGMLACAHSTQESRTSSTVSEIAPQDREVIAVATPPPTEAPPPAARPRLSRTVTLGQGTGDSAQYAPSPAPSARAAPGQNQSVVVNNNIIVSSPPAYGYGYGGYGYGYGYSGFAPRGADHFGSRSSAASWGSSGWEGARRTAAPGQTPGIGGNWPSAPSYGPAQMK